MTEDGLGDWVRCAGTGVQGFEPYDTLRVWQGTSSSSLPCYLETLIHTMISTVTAAVYKDMMIQLVSAGRLNR